MLKQLLPVSLFCLLGVSLTFGQQKEIILPNPAEAITDTLSNGLRYIIHPTKDNSIALRLVLNVGSLQEEDQEKGYAHFLEHMVFNGSEDFPGWSAVDTLSSLGYRYGIDINAYTTYERTVYQLALLKQEHVSLGLHILANFLNKANLEENALIKEQRIVTQEINDFGEEDTVSKKKLEGTLHHDRLPIATTDAIQKITQKSLQAFYDKWYTPSLASIIIVGNVDKLTIEKEIKRLFQTKNRTSNKDRKQNIGTFAPLFTSNLFTKTTNKPSNTLEIIRFTPTALLQTQADLKVQIAEQLYKSYLSKKIKQAESDALFHSTWYLSNRNEHTVVLKAASEKELKHKIKCFSSIVHTLKADGVDKDDLTIEINAMLKSLERERTSPASNYIGDAYVDQVAGYHHYLDNATLTALSKQLITEITVKDLEEVHEKIWFSDNSVLYISEQNPKIYDLKEVRALEKNWKKGSKIKTRFQEQSSPLLTYNESITSWPPLITNQEERNPVYIKKENYYPALNITEFTLSNGLNVTIKPTANSDQQIALSYISSKGILNSILTNKPIYFKDASYFISGAWITGLSVDEYFDLLINKDITAISHVGEYNSEVTLVSRSNNLDDLFQLAYRKLFSYTMPQADFEEYITHEIASLNGEKKESAFLTMPSVQLQQQIAEYKHGRSILTEELKTQHDWKSVSLPAMFNLYDTIIRDYNHNHLIITGPVEIEDVKQKIHNYFSFLPSASENEVVLTKAQIINEKTRVNIEDSLVHRPETTIVYKGKLEKTVKNAILAHLVKEVFNQAFLLKSREQEGLVYSPFVEVELSFQQQLNTFITLNFTSSKEEIVKLEEIANVIIKQLTEEQIKDSEVDRIKRLISTNKSRHLTDDAVMNWNEKIKEYYINFGSIEGFNNYDILLQDITPHDIKEAAKTMLSTENYALFSLE